MRRIQLVPALLSSALLAVGGLSAAETEWQILFDGKNTDAWRTFRSSSFPGKGWVIEGECLKHVAGGGGGDIITKETYEQFELAFDWKIAPGGNSGVKYFITPKRGGPIGHEYQLIDDEGHSDGRRGGDRTTAGFYDVLPPDDAAKQLNPPGSFNHSRIVVDAAGGQHWLNGKKVLEYKFGSSELKKAIEDSKFKDVAGFGEPLSGHILLQDHGDEVCFKNIRIRRLNEAP